MILIWLVNTCTRLLSILILLRVAALWIDPERRHEMTRALNALTQPVLMPFRRLFYLRGLKFDLSPLAALVALEVLRAVMVWVLRGLFGG